MVRMTSSNWKLNILFAFATLATLSSFATLATLSLAGHDKDAAKATDEATCAFDDAQGPNCAGLQTLSEFIQTGRAINILVACGAGISVTAGIPDFRSPGTGLYDNLEKYDLPSPEAVFDLGFYRKNPKPFTALAKDLWPQLKRSVPTVTHHFLELLHEKGLLLRIYTQNIDGFEVMAGIPEDKLVECHGHFRTASCINCGKPADIRKVFDAIKDGHTPSCDHCGSYVKPDIVFFGESLPERFHQFLTKDLEKADLLLVMGTSLQVAPVSMIPRMAACKRVLFNRELVLDMRPDDIFVEGDCDANVEKLCSLLGWEEELRKRSDEIKKRKF